MLKGLKAARERRGLTQAALSELMDVAQSYISMLENGGKVNPSYEFMRNAAAVLGTDIDSLVNGPIADLKSDSKKEIKGDK